MLILIYTFNCFQISYYHVYNTDLYTIELTSKNYKGYWIKLF